LTSFTGDESEASSSSHPMVSITVMQ